MQNYKLKSGGSLIEISAEEIEKLDIIRTGEDSFHALSNGKSYQIQVLEEDQNDKTISLSVNGTHYDFTIEDRLDSLIREMGYNKKADHRFSDLSSPMPGLILDILVKEGQEVNEGDPMLILEAMKMENVLKAPGKGVIGKILSEKGETVEKNQVLIEME